MPPPCNTATGGCDSSVSALLAPAVAGLFLAPDRRRPPLGISAVDVSAVTDEGLLHDASNLIGALGLYCDLLSLPNVLRPEHRHYAEEVRLLGSRTAAMIEQLIELRMLALPALDPLNLPDLPNLPNLRRMEPARKAAEADGRAVGAGGRARQPMSLRSIVERCSGLLSSVAGGRSVEVSYGEAAALPVRVAAESVERILVNLVRNASRALEECGLESAALAQPVEERMERTGRAAWRGGRGAERGAVAGSATVARNAGAVRIHVGVLISRTAPARPWPFQRVRLVVEDSGCGMGPEQLDQLLRGGRALARARHGIGFHVVRDLVQASGGELSVTSAPGVGTQVQMEWPLAPPSAASGDEGGSLPSPVSERRASRVSHDERHSAQPPLNSLAAQQAQHAGQVQQARTGRFRARDTAAGWPEGKLAEVKLDGFKLREVKLPEVKLMDRSRRPSQRISQPGAAAEKWRS